MSTVCSENSGTQGNRELSEYSQHFHTVFSKIHFNILCPLAGFCGPSNEIPDGRFIILSTGRLLRAPQTFCLWSSTVQFTEVSAEQG